MVLYQNYSIYVSVFIFWIIKILCDIAEKYRVSMYNKQPTLTSIPERNETEEEVLKWVPKKKHEILKAKYKCLKKLFQIYDASVIGILPETYSEQEPLSEETRTHRRRRSRRTKTDACAGTTEFSSGDVTQSETEKDTIATAVIKDLKLNYSSSQVDRSKTTIIKYKDDKSTQESKETLSITSEKSCDSGQIQCEPHPMPYLVINEKRKPTRFQSFIQRLLGIKRESRYNYVLQNTKVYAASDNNISNRYEKRRRRGLRFRRSRRPKKIHSEIALRDAKSPIILSYVQSVQRNCLLDTTPRQCPIMGCNMISYGIINYNDHLNLCHFPDRKYICHYCHEGFTSEYDKIVHENEHIGITKLSNNHCTTPPSIRRTSKIASDTQTDPELSKIDVPEEKLKKIVSFFDKICDPEQMIAEMKKNRFSESNLQTIHRNPNENTDSETSKSDSDKRTCSCVNLQQKTGSKLTTSIESDVMSKNTCDLPIRCRMCGEGFDYRRQLSLHVDLEHRVHDKFSKFHSCAGIVNRHDSDDEGKLTRDATKTFVRCAPSSTEGFEGSEISKRKSDESLSCDPSTNIIYYTSTESIDKKPSVVSSIVQKVRSGFCYRWEPGTKIIRV